MGRSEKGAEMKLLKSEISKITKEFDLGKPKSIDLIKGGLVNYNFYLKTDKGLYVIRVIGEKLSKWKRQRLEIEFKSLDYLKNKKFPYEIPNPIRDKKGKALLRINKKNIWVYKKMKGAHWNKNKTQFKEIGKALAIYHKYIRSLKITNKNEFFGLGWLLPKYSKLKKIKPKNKIDLLILNNVSFFEKLLKKFIRTKFNKNILLIHHDIDPSNILFKKNRLSAILDFENIKSGPRIADIANTIKDVCFKKDKLEVQKVNLILNGYEKITKLSKKEKEFIIPSMILDNCTMFWWFYGGMKKDLDNRYKYLNSTIKMTKDIAKKLN